MSCSQNKISLYSKLNKKWFRCALHRTQIAMKIILTIRGVRSVWGWNSGCEKGVSAVRKWVKRAARSEWWWKVGRCPQRPFYCLPVWRSIGENMRNIQFVRSSASLAAPLTIIRHLEIIQWWCSKKDDSFFGSTRHGHRDRQSIFKWNLRFALVNYPYLKAWKLDQAWFDREKKGRDGFKDQRRIFRFCHIKTHSLVINLVIQRDQSLQQRSGTLLCNLSYSYSFRKCWWPWRNGASTAGVLCNRSKCETETKKIFVLLLVMGDTPRFTENVDTGYLHHL